MHWQDWIMTASMPRLFGIDSCFAKLAPLVFFFIGSTGFNKASVNRRQLGLKLAL